MPYSTSGKNVMLDALGTAAGFVSAHASDPGDSGTGEISGGAPAYARKAITWNAAAAGSKTASNSPVIDVEGGDTVAFVGLWSASTAGTFYGSADVTDEVFGGQGTYTVTSFTLSIT